MMSFFTFACMGTNEGIDRTDEKQTIREGKHALNIQDFEAIMEELDFTVEHNIVIRGTEDAVGARDPDYKYYIQYINFTEENDAKDFYDSYVEYMENCKSTGEYEGSIIKTTDGYDKCVISLCRAEWVEGSHLPNEMYHEMYVVDVRDGNCTLRIFVDSYSGSIANEDIAEANRIMEKLGY
jgi:hypothetical protein